MTWDEMAKGQAMTESVAPSFTPEEAMRAHKALRDAVGPGNQDFPLHDLIGMLSDEIEMLRGKGHSDAEIAGMITAATGKEVSEGSVQTLYVPPTHRRR